MLNIIILLLGGINLFASDGDRTLDGLPIPEEQQKSTKVIQQIPENSDLTA